MKPPKTVEKTLGDRVRLTRETMKLGVNELTRLVRQELDRMGHEGPSEEGQPALSDGYISRIESGKRRKIPPRHLAALARALNVTSEWLAMGAGPQRFASGELPATFAAAKSDKKNLEKVLGVAKRSRWSPTTIAAARAMAADLPVEEWAAKLDHIQEALAPVVAAHDRPERH